MEADHDATLDVYDGRLPGSRWLLVRRMRTWVQSPLETVLAFDLFELGARMTLVMLLLSLHETAWYIKLGIVTPAVAALVLRPLLRNPFLWLGLTAVFVLAFSQNWYTQNNHDYLKLYWCLGIGLSLMLADPSEALRTNARLLIGLCFLFAFLWKALSPDYMNHAFFNYFLLQDSRFGLLAESVAGLDPSAVLSGRVDRVVYTEFGDPEIGMAVPLAGAVRWLAPLMTWWTLFIEGLVAAAFLCPPSFRFAWWRDSLLLMFILSTYFVAPILYFAWLLIAMGIIQCERDRYRHWPAAYVAVFFLVLIRFYLPV